MLPVGVIPFLFTFETSWNMIRSGDMNALMGIVTVLKAVQSLSRDIAGATRRTRERSADVI